MLWFLVAANRVPNLSMAGSPFPARVLAVEKELRRPPKVIDLLGRHGSENARQWRARSRTSDVPGCGSVLRHS